MPCGKQGGLFYLQDKRHKEPESRFLGMLASTSVMPSGSLKTLLRMVSVQEVADFGREEQEERSAHEFRRPCVTVLHKPDVQRPVLHRKHAAMLMNATRMR